MSIYPSLSTTDSLYFCLMVVGAIYMFFRGKAGVQPKAMFALSACLLASAIATLFGQPVLQLVFGGVGCAVIGLLEFSKKRWKEAKRKKLAARRDRSE